MMILASRAGYCICTAVLALTLVACMHMNPSRRTVWHTAVPNERSATSNAWLRLWKQPYSMTFGASQGEAPLCIYVCSTVNTGLFVSTRLALEDLHLVCPPLHQVRNVGRVGISGTVPMFAFLPRRFEDHPFTSSMASSCGEVGVELVKMFLFRGTPSQTNCDIEAVAVVSTTVHVQGADRFERVVLNVPLCVKWRPKEASTE